MMIAPLAVLVLMNALLKLFPKATSTKLIPKYAPIVALAPMYARLKQYILSNRDKLLQNAEGAICQIAPLAFYVIAGSIEFFQY